MGCIVVFAKPPVPGRVKTRLGRIIGHELAAELAGALLADSVTRWRDTGHEVLLATPEPDTDHGIPREVEAVSQGEGSLGARIERGLCHGLARADWAMAVGADGPAVPSSAVDEALAGLRSGRTILGPSEDGGFWALGLHVLEPDLLAGLPWSHPTTGRRTRARLVERGLDPLDVGAGWDVDEPRDLHRLARHDDLAPRSAAMARRILAAG